MTAARSPALDGLRAVAALAVLAVHAPRALGGQWETILGRWAGQGTLGVDVFFVLSGYLITAGLLADRAAGRGLGGFWLRRARRIVPPYALYLATLLVLARTTPLLDRLMDFDPGGDWALYLTPLGNLPVVMGRDPGLVLLPLWSVAVEEQFYLLWPLALALPGRRAAWVAVAGVLAAVGLRWVLEPGLSGHALYHLGPARLDGLLVGALVAMGRATPRGRLLVAALSERARGAALPFLALVAGTAGGTFFADHRGWCALSPLLVALATAVVLVELLEGRGALARVLAWRPLVAIGRASYGLYLWHCLLGVVLRRVLPTAWPLELRALLWAVVSVAWAALLFERIERPLTAAGHRAPLAAT